MWDSTYIFLPKVRYKKCISRKCSPNSEPLNYIFFAENDAFFRANLTYQNQFISVAKVHDATVDSDIFFLWRIIFAAFNNCEHSLLWNLWHLQALQNFCRWLRAGILTSYRSILRLALATIFYYIRTTS